MGSSKRRTLSARQLQIMDVVWRQREVSVADVWEALGGARSVARNTVQTMMSRLEEQGWLRCRAKGQAHFYSAAQSRRKVASSLISGLLRGVFGGSPSQLMMALLDAETLSSEEAARHSRPDRPG